MAGRISTAAPLKWRESPRSHKPFLGDLAVAILPRGAGPILDTICCERLAHHSAIVRAMTWLPAGGGVGDVQRDGAGRAILRTG
jgi:hypothetical protein